MYIPKSSLPYVLRGCETWLYCSKEGLVLELRMLENAVLGTSRLSGAEKEVIRE